MKTSANPFLECPKCKAGPQFLTRIGVRQFECLSCTELFDVKAADENERPGVRGRSLDKGSRLTG